MTAGTGDDGLTRDAFLGGRLHMLQPRTGYRAGIDPVLLAASVAATPGQSVLELGCGAGVVILCLGARIPGLHLTGVEVQAAYADLARRNAALNAQTLDVVQADLRALPAALRQRSFDHIIANPPYYDRDHGTASQDAGRDMALGGQTPLKDWIDAAARRLAPRGYLTMIQRAARLPELLCALQGGLGSVVVLPIAGRAGRPAHLVIVQARKGGRAAFRLCAPLILHEGATHHHDGDSYTPRITAILRSAADLSFGC